MSELQSKVVPFPQDRYSFGIKADQQPQRSPRHQEQVSPEAAELLQLLRLAAEAQLKTAEVQVMTAETLTRLQTYGVNSSGSRGPARSEGMSIEGTLAFDVMHRGVLERILSHSKLPVGVQAGIFALATSEDLESLRENLEGLLDIMDEEDSVEEHTALNSTEQIGKEFEQDRVQWPVRKGTTMDFAGIAEEDDINGDYL